MILFRLLIFNIIQLINILWFVCSCFLFSRWSSQNHSERTGKPTLFLDLFNINCSKIHGLPCGPLEVFGQYNIFSAHLVTCLQESLTWTKGLNITSLGSGLEDDRPVKIKSWHENGPPLISNQWSCLRKTKIFSRPCTVSLWVTWAYWRSRNDERDSKSSGPTTSHHC